MEPWYKDGLRFTCTQCGDCCTGAPGVVWVDDDEITAIATYRNETVEVFRATSTRYVGGRISLREHGNGDCIFLTPTRGCAIYPVRPGQCRTWPFWESNVAMPADWASASKVCPGMGRGELIPVEEITRRLQVIKI